MELRNHDKVSRRQRVCSTVALAVLAAPRAVDGLRPSSLKGPCTSPWSLHKARTILFSSVGGGRPSGDDNTGGLGDFLTPKDESESLKRAREYLSETSLPISFDVEASKNANDNDDVTKDSVADKLPNGSSPQPENPTSSAMVGAFGMGGPSSLMGTGSEPSAAALAKNPYMQVVSKLTPSELISKFTASASPRVQDAVRTTVLGLIGSLPKMAFETTTITTGQRLASLMFQLQMTGYMLKNADYRLSLSQSLGVTNAAPVTSNLLLTGTAKESVDDEDDPLTSGKVKGKIKVRYVGSHLFGTGSNNNNNNNKSSDGVEIEVDAAAYMSELRAEVSKLREELMQRKEAKEEVLRKDLLLYIRTLPAQELRSLTNTMSQDVLVCMKGLVQAVLAGIGDGNIGPDTVTEQSGEAMAQLCMWQLAVGYNLRELEVREEMKRSLQKVLQDDVFEGGLEGTLE